MDPNPDGHEFVLQTTPSSRSTCYNCLGPLQLGSVRFGIWSAHDELQWLQIWRFRHVDCVTTSEIEQALTVYETVQGIPTLIKQGLGGIPEERREECNVVLTCTLNGQQKPEDVVQRLKSNPDQHVWDLLQDAKSRRIRTPGSKKQDKFDAAKAAIESVRDQATGHFDVDEALGVLKSKRKTKTKTRSKSRATKMLKGKQKESTKKRSRKRKAEITDGLDGAPEADPPRRPSTAKRPKARKTNKIRKVKKEESGTNNAGESRSSPQACGGGGRSTATVKEEETEGNATVNPAAAPSAMGGAGSSAFASSTTTTASSAAADVKAGDTSSPSAGLEDFAYTGPRTRSRSKRSRS